jgi:hypothetical protein
MSTGAIIASLSFLLLCLVFFIRGVNSWHHRNEGTGHDVDLEQLKRGNALTGGGIEPATISRIERLLQKEADKQQSDS